MPADTGLASAEKYEPPKIVVAEVRRLCGNIAQFQAKGQNIDSAFIASPRNQAIHNGLGQEAADTHIQGSRHTCLSGGRHQRLPFCVCSARSRVFAQLASLSPSST